MKVCCVSVNYLKFLEADLNRDGFIDADEYKKIVALHPSTLGNMTLDLPRVLELRLEAAKQQGSKRANLKS